MDFDRENTESSFESIEDEAESLQERGNELEQRKSKLSEAIAQLEKDPVVTKSLEANEQDLENQREDLESRRTSALASLAAIQEALEGLENANEQSNAELDALRALGEDVSEADSVIEDRRRWLQESYARVQHLYELLGESYEKIGDFSASGEKGLREFGEDSVEDGDRSSAKHTKEEARDGNVSKSDAGDLSFVTESSPQLEEVASIAGRSYEECELFTQSTGIFADYSGHKSGHIRAVYEEVGEVLQELGKLPCLPEGYARLGVHDKMTLQAAALLHDTGMIADHDSLAALCDKGFEDVLARGGKDAEILLRSNHGISAALNALKNREALERAGVDPDLVAIDCAVHSKSGSGVRDLSSEEQWSRLFDRIETATQRRGVTFDKSKFVNADGSVNKRMLERCASHAYCMRVADANGHDMNDNELQSGEQRIVDRDGFVPGPPDAGWEKEARANKVLAMHPDGSRREITDTFGKGYAMGEGNIRKLSMRCEGTQMVEHIVVDRADFAPESTMMCVGERAEELATARGVPGRIEVEVDVSNIPSHRIEALEDCYNAAAQYIESMTEKKYRNTVKVVIKYKNK